MLRRLSALHNRYAAARLVLKGPSGPIVDAEGDEVGYIDEIEVIEGRLRVAGWVRAAKVTLVLAEAETNMVPRLRREDVAQARDFPAEIGFDLSMPCTPEMLLTSDAPGLICEALVGHDDIPPLSLKVPWTSSRRWGMMFRFGRDMAIVAPAIMGWYATGNPIYRARVKDRLGLNMIAAAEELVPGLFDGPPSTQSEVPDRRITIVLPVYNAFDLLPDVLARIKGHTDLPWRLIMIEDGSTDDRVLPFLRDWVAQHADHHDITLVENPENCGFIRSVNDGLARAMGHTGRDEGPIILLNSDAFVPKNWASRLVRPLLEDASIASTTPMSNDAEIFSAPVICAKTNLAPGLADRIDERASEFNPDCLQLDVPTGVGFCMGMNRDWLEREPQFDTVFGRGYGEEVDWCQKVRARGGRHVAVPNLYVEHRGGESFGSDTKLALIARNNDIVSKRYPDYDGEVQRYIGGDPLGTARLALGLEWAGSLELDQAIPVYLAHTLGGGAQVWLEARVAETVADGIPVVLLRVGGTRHWQIELHAPGGITRGSTDDTDLMHDLLARLPRRNVIYSCGVGTPDPAGLPTELVALAQNDNDRVEILFHDFFPLSPSYTLLDADGVYRGPPDDARTDTAHQAWGIDGHRVPLTDWQAAWKTLADRAAALHVFSEDSGNQVRAVWPDLSDRIVVSPHPLPYTPPELPKPKADAPPVLAVLGNIGLQKGAAVLQELAAMLDTAASTAQTKTPRLVLIGNIDPAYALPAHVRVHGSYLPSDIPDLVRQYGVTHWLIPSIWPETFSYTTHETLATGLPVLAFDIGAQGEAVRSAQNGVPVPLPPLPRAKTQLSPRTRNPASFAAQNVVETLDAHRAQTAEHSDQVSD